MEYNFDLENLEFENSPIFKENFIRQTFRTFQVGRAVQN